MNPAEYRLQIKAAMARNPGELVFPIYVDGRKCWVKHRPYSKKNNWHRLQALFAFLSGMALFNPTVSLGGAGSLHQEAQRLNLLRDHGISVPEVMVAADDFLITDDRGVQLQDWIEDLDNIEERLYWLKRAVSLLIQVHQAGFAHGRPMPKDMLVHDNTLTLIDLEDDPLQVMSLAEAQARDIWLFMNAAARLLNEDPERTRLVFECCRTGMSLETQIALRRLVAFIRPFSRVSGKTSLAACLGRDLRQALFSNEVIATGLFP